MTNALSKSFGILGALALTLIGQNKRFGILGAHDYAQLPVGRRPALRQVRGGLAPFLGILGAKDRHCRGAFFIYPEDPD